MLDARFRAGLDKATGPVGAALARGGIRANQLTVVGLVAAVLASITIAGGRLGLGAALVALAGLPDLLDGPVARACGSASRRGEFFDSVADRVSDSFLLGGIAWYLAAGHSPRMALLPTAVLAASLLISYERAKAEALGFTAKGGLMERGERTVAIFVGLAGGPGVLMVVLWAMAALTAVTAAQRFALVWRQASHVQAPSGPVGDGQDLAGIAGEHSEPRQFVPQGQHASVAGDGEADHEQPVVPVRSPVALSVDMLIQAWRDHAAAREDSERRGGSVWSIRSGENGQRWPTRRGEWSERRRKTRRSSSRSALERIRSSRHESARPSRRRTIARSSARELADRTSWRRGWPGGFGRD